MTSRWAAYMALIALATTGCSAGAGSSQLPATPISVQSENPATSPQNARRDAASRRLATPVPLATNLNDPTSLVLHGSYLYIGDVGVVDRVHRNGGPVATLLTGTSIFDSGSDRGVNRMAFHKADILAGFGGYNSYDVVTAPIATGVKTILATPTGGYFIGTIGTNLYYGRGFCCIDALPLAGGAATTVLSGVWVRAVETDATAIYFIEYFSRNVDRFDTTTMTLTPLLTGNPTEGQIAIDMITVYFSHGTTIQAIPKTGGSPTTIYTGIAPRVLAANGTQVFLTDGPDLKVVPVTGGPARTLASGFSIAVATASKTELFFTDNSQGFGHSIVYRIRTTP